MNGANSITRPDNPLQRRLQNVFCVLAKPGHKLQQQAIKLRQEVSFAWRDQATEGKWFPWPTTDATRGARELKGVHWWQRGMLGFLGYHVGEAQPTPRDIRQRILEYAFECHLPPLNGSDYYLQWSDPQTAQRLEKLSNTLASFTRNAKRRTDISYTTAIDGWEGDLAYLHERYYVNFFHFEWPTSDYLH